MCRLKRPGGMLWPRFTRRAASKLEADIAETLRDLRQDAAFVSFLARNEGDAEPQIRAGVVPWHRRKELFGDQPLRSLLRVLEAKTFSVRQHRRLRRLDVKEERALGLDSIEARLAQRGHQPSHPP